MYRAGSSCIRFLLVHLEPLPYSSQGLYSGPHSPAVVAGHLLSPRPWLIILPVHYRNRSFFRIPEGFKCHYSCKTSEEQAISKGRRSRREISFLAFAQCQVSPDQAIVFSYPFSWHSKGFMSIIHRCLFGRWWPMTRVRL